MKAAPERLQSGLPEPLGATPDANGVNFALFSRHAERVELCLFDEDGTETARHALLERSGDVWHGYLAGARVGLRYGYRVHGPFAPGRGHRFNPCKLLLDPYARAWDGGFAYDKRLLGDGDEGSPDLRDSADAMPKCVVTPPPPLVGDDGRPATSWGETILYEAHAKGLTVRHPGVDPSKRGRLAGLAEPAILDHLTRLGVTAIELLPLQAFFDEPFLVAKGLSNHWGYNPVGFFVPEPRYAAGLDGARGAVAALHAAGIEVILDVVYNHTGEGDAAGPTLAYRGLDNAAYYRLDGACRYVNVTGCGNTLDVDEPFVLRLALDSLRYWVEAVGVDGFRFDLATTLGREGEGYSPNAAFFDAIRQDPILRVVKLIAEPWDIGPEGYRLGQFPPPFAEWNDRFRDAARAFWRGDENVGPELAARLAGSADLFPPERRAYASVNYVTAHDGFTLMDMVSYLDKHNDANGEDNRDGHGHNLSMNGGVEGRSDDPDVLAYRRRQRRNLLATTLFARGVPMLLMGDEFGRTQGGNNNAYCQDNPTAWVDWENADADFAAEVAVLVGLRRRHPALRRGRAGPGEAWLTTAGTIAPPDPPERAFGLLLPDGFLLLLNGRDEATRFTLPPGAWRVAVDTARTIDGVERAVEGDAVTLGPVSLALLHLGG